MEKENKKFKIIKRLLITLVIIIFICIIATIGIGNYIIKPSFSKEIFEKGGEHFEFIRFNLAINCFIIT